MDSTQTFTLHVSEETHHDITVEVPDELLDDMRQAGVDTSDTSAVAKWLTDNLDPDDGLITDVISDTTISGVTGREVTDVVPALHEHEWVFKQNVTTKGTVMPAHKVCDCGAATEVADGDAPGREIGCDNEFCKSMRAMDQTRYVALEARAEQAEEDADSLTQRVEAAEDDRAALLAHVNHLTAENTRLQGIAEQVRAETLAGFTEERTDLPVGSRVPCDCPGDWQHHARLLGDDSPPTHAHFDFVPSVRLVGPWEPVEPRLPGHVERRDGKDAQPPIDVPARPVAPVLVSYADAFRHAYATADAGTSFVTLGRRYVVKCEWCPELFHGETKAEAVAAFRIHERERLDIVARSSCMGGGCAGAGCQGCGAAASAQQRERYVALLNPTEGDDRGKS